MLSTELFYVKSDALKNRNFDMLEHVKTLIRHTELDNAMNKKAFKDGKKALEKDHADINVMECEETVIRASLGNDSDEFIKARKEIIALRKECDSLLPLENVTSLCLTDKVHITLMAHAIYNRVLLPSDIFDTKQGGIDISKAIQKYYNNGTIKDLKDALRPVFNKLIGTEGDHFYGIKTKKSDFTDKDLRNFFATFGGSAKREKNKSKDKNGKEILIFKDFNYVDKSENKKTQLAAFTTFCAVVLDNASKHEVIKPEAQEEIAE